MNTMIRAFLLGLFVVALTTACSKAEEPIEEVTTIDLSEPMAESVETVQEVTEATEAEIAEAKEEAVDAIQAAKDAAAE